MNFKMKITFVPTEYLCDVLLLLFKIAENSLYYDGHVNLISTLRELMELEEARKAREAMSAVYPLSPGKLLRRIKKVE